MMVSFILCLLPALLATASAQETLTCNVCFGQTEACSFAPGICQDNKATGACLSVAEVIKLDGTQSTYFYKQCLGTYASDINVPISFTVGNGKYVRINTARCNNTDKCNSAALGVPTVNATKNGLQCPTCFALNYTACNSQDTPCTGDETYCMDFTGFLYQGTSHSPFQAKGCTTASPQVIKPGTTLTTIAYTFNFFWGASVPAEKIPTSPPPTTTAPLETTPTTAATTTAATTTPTPTTTTTRPKKTTTTKTTTVPGTTPTPTSTTTTPATTTTTNTTTAATPTATTTPNTTTTTPSKTTTPETTTTNKTTTPKTTLTPRTTATTTKPTTPPKTTTPTKPTTLHQTTHNGGSPALGKFSFALYRLGLTGLLLVRLLS